MVALDFPDSPTNGQVFDKWTWNGTQWVLTAGSDGVATMPKGIISFGNGPTGAGPAIGTTPVQISGMFVTGALKTGRWYRVATAVQLSKDATAGLLYLKLADGGQTVNYRTAAFTAAAGAYLNLRVDHTFKAAADATTTFISYVNASAGTATYLGTPYHGWTSLEDLGTLAA